MTAALTSRAIVRFRSSHYLALALNHLPNLTLHPNPSLANSMWKKSKMKMRIKNRNRIKRKIRSKSRIHTKITPAPGGRSGFRGGNKSECGGCIPRLGSHTTCRGGDGRVPDRAGDCRYSDIAP